ncbi:lactonase family protein [Zunongwangia sp. SCSIO 43204]|uniref:lactonase family protein n=1 Tax=Zunongwangia sp. SCSIO 43204 TaxID=2779359 RepID=UPI001CA8365E|nr:lactonase family protein [Zunongwangia sp. SCSIO 43204]UAB83037.1 lactonase family protein [Zunongwangia sp. SCSIO 43204]
MINRKLAVAILIAGLSLSSCKNDKNENAEEDASKNTEKMSKMNTAFIGTYTKKEGHVDGKADGILTIKQDPKTGKISLGKTVAEVINPSFVKLSGDNKYLYAVSELGDKDGKSGFIHSFQVKENDSLIEVDKVSTEAFAPCHIEIDKTNKFAFVSNYMGGVVVMYRIQQDGSLEKRKQLNMPNSGESHTHSVSISADNKHIYICDLGLDKIWIYDLDAEEKTIQKNEQESVSLAEGAGPRHFALGKNQKFAYSMNELNSTVSIFKIEENGGLSLQNSVSSIPEDFTENNSGADIHISDSGDYLYVSNRGHDSIAIFKIDQDTGELENIDYASTNGKTPRNFAISEGDSYLYAANQDSGDIQAYKINEETGELDAIGEPVAVPTPVCIEFLK